MSGDQALFDAYLQAERDSAAHRDVCTKGCELEPPDRCNRGFRLRQAAGAAWDAFEQTLPRPVFGRSR